MSETTLRDSLNLPQTDFPMRAGLPKQEPVWVQRWEEEGIYNRIRERREGATPFILHCGPPYANGNLHIGHALNSTLKDIVVRSQNMMGRDAVFVPGWDCHGLPIEWKIEEGFKAKSKTKEDYSTKEIRALCREFADKWVNVQKEDMRRFGVSADLDNEYRTMNPKNEAGILRELGRMASSGLLYKGAKSIMWSIVEETSLAEAEIEYHDHESTAIFMKFPVVGKDNESVVIWTTTPWTLPANQAVAYGKDFDYSLIEATQTFEKAIAEVGDKVWVATDLIEEFTKMTGIEAHNVVATQKGSAFEGTMLKHCFYDEERPMVEGFHVTADSGSGFVHIAPSHGADDFEVGKQFDLDLFCRVDGKGRYAEDVNDLPLTGVELTGMVIWDAQKKILAETTENRNLMRWYKFKHSYPMSWRSKKPIVFRTTPQWFLALDKEAHAGKTVRQIATDAIEQIGHDGGWVPATGQNRINSFVETRPDWCISRQRCWGVPIAIMQHKPSGEFTFDMEVFEHIANLFETQGLDAWDTLSVEELLPAGYLESKGWKAEDMVKETDILDVWFDSGTTYAHVVEEQMEQELPADLYLEGSDQHRGWFNSSLMASCATRGKAPYKQVLTHGFVVDGEGKKMSKSVGNVVAPADVMKKYGMDILRLWVAASDYNEDVRYSEEIMKGISDSYRRFRNTYRFLLGNLYDFDENEHVVQVEDMPELEQWVLSKFEMLLKENEDYYNTYQFRRVYENMHNFCAKELSNLYFDIRKDSLYCDPRVETEEGVEYYHRRRSCQTVLNILLKGLATHMAPVMPFTSDEVYRSRFGDESVHLQEFFMLDGFHDKALEEKWEKVWQTRDAANMKSEELRSSGAVGHNYEVAVQIPETEGLSMNEWADVLVVSEVSEGSDIVASKVEGQKCERSWRYVSGEEAVTLEDGTIVSKRDAISLKANATLESAA